MNILIIGMGPIGTLYGSLFSRAGHYVEHFLKSDVELPETIDIALLDGRINPKGKETEYCYHPKIHEKKEYDFILVSVGAVKLAHVMKDLREAKIHGTVILFSDVWVDHMTLDKIMGFYPYILGHPASGGYFIEPTKLKGAVSDYVRIESESKARIDNYNLLMTLFKGCDLTFEIPNDMLEWMWVHAAITTAFASNVAHYGNINYTEASVKHLMSDGKALRDVIKTVKETLLIAKGRGINMNHFNQELVPYKFPIFISALSLRLMFKTNRLYKEIVLNQRNVDNYLHQCYDLYLEGKRQCLEMPVLTRNMESLLVFLEEQEHIDVGYYQSIVKR